MFKNVRFVLLYHVVKLFLASELIDFKLALKFLLLLDLLLSCLQIALEVQKEIRLLNHLKSFLELIVFLH